VQKGRLQRRSYIYAGIGVCDDLTGRGKNKTIDERTQSNEEEDAKFELFRVIFVDRSPCLSRCPPFSADY